ncbi:endonuclease/exonuclease/phosphatase family protein [Actinoallomurus acanthiterrae]
MQMERAGLFPRWAARLAVAMSVAWLAIAVLHRLFSGRFWLWVLPDLVPPPVYLVVPLALLAAAAVGLFRGPRRWAMAAGGAAAVALILGFGQAGLNPRALTVSGRVPAGALHIVSWNTEYWDQTDDPAHFYRYLTAQHADVYVLQEYLHWVNNGPAPVDDVAGLRQAFPGYQMAISGELVTLSRYPIVATPPIATAWPEDPSWYSQFQKRKVLRTDLDVGGRTLSVYNVHIPVQLGQRRLLHASFYRDVHTRVRHRTAEYSALRRDVAANHNPKLIAGDFNTTASMGEVGWFRSHLSDAVRADGSLYPASWPSVGPTLWRLDWAFTTGLHVYRYGFRSPEGMSDHRAQDLWLSLRSNADQTR